MLMAGVHMSRPEQVLNWRSIIASATFVIGALILLLGPQKLERRVYGKREWQRSLIHKMQVKAATLASWNRQEKFRDAYRQAIDSDEDSLSVSNFISSSSIETSVDEMHVEQLIVDFLRVVKDTPDEDGAWNDLAWLYAMNGETVNAIDAEQEAISIYGYDYAYYVVLGAIYEHSGNIDGTKIAYGRALTLYPRLAISPFWRSLMTRSPSLAAASEREAMMVLDTQTSDEIHRNESRARLMVAAGLDNEASDIVHSINEKIPNLSGMWELQGELFEKSGQQIEAILDYRRAAFLDPTDTLPHERLAALELKLSNPDIEDAKNQVQLVWQLSKRQHSSGSKRRAIQYRDDAGLRNGLLPGSLMSETQPSFDFAEIFEALAKAFASRGEEEKAEKLEQMIDDATSN
jgi:tetratricopeptide (TPR) repeat protein